VAVSDRIQEKFEEFHSDNPFILGLLEKLADEWLREHEQVGMKMLWEALRWRLGVDPKVRVDTYRLNNNYTSRYARLLLESHPEWQGRIKTRALVAA
jgi:hypothetical protein